MMNLLFETFNNGKLLLPEKEVDFAELPWNMHPTFEGVELKHIITSHETSGAFSYHLVKIEPNKKISNHVHEMQVETHEIIAGSGICINNGVILTYTPGTMSIFPKSIPHEVHADDDGLLLFAKFIPALC